MKKMGGRHYQLWDEEDGFFYDVLRYARRQLRQVPRALPGRPHPAVRGRAPGGALDRALPRVPRQLRLVPEQQVAHRAGRVPPVEARRRATSTCWRSWTRRRCERLLARVLRPGRVPLALRPAQPLEAPRAAPLPVFGDREVRYEPAEAEREDQGRQLELARPGLVPHHVPDDRVAAQAGHGLSAPTSRCPPTATNGPQRTLWQVAEDIANRMIRIFTRDAQRPPPRLRQRAASSRRTRTGATSSCSTSTSTATPARAWAPRTRPAGRASSRR